MTGRQGDPAAVQQEPTEAEIRWDTWLDLAQARDGNPGGVTAEQVGVARNRWEEAAATEREQLGAAEREAEREAGS